MSDEVPLLVLPPHLARLKLPVGKHRRSFKALAWGEAGSGKSKFLAQFPSPKVVIDTGEGGISGYLDPDSGDELFEVTNPDTYVKVVEFTLSRPDHFRSIVTDTATILWEDWMDYFNTEFGGDIRGGQWKDVKSPWKLLHRKMMRSGLNVGYAAWVDDIVYDQAEGPRGEKGKLTIRRQEQPKVEKRLPHNVDLALQFAIRRDNLGRPTTKHTATVSKCRRPRSVEPEELFEGKTWVFDTKQEVDLWNLIIDPLIGKWREDSEDNMTASADDMEEEKELAEAAKDLCMSRMIRLIGMQTSLDNYKQVFAKEIQPFVNQLDDERRAAVMTIHEQKKEELANV